MKKKVLSTLLVFSLMFSMAAPSFAALPSTMTPERQAELRAELTGIIYNNLSSTTDLVNSLLGGDLIKNLAQGLINDYLDLESLLGLGGGLAELAGPALGDLIEGMLADAGITLPDSINIDEIISEVLGNEGVTNVITSILTNEFVTEVLNRTIAKVFDSFDFTQLMSPVLLSIADNIAEELWNNGNPSTTIIVGSWDNSRSRWNSTGIALQLVVKIPSVGEYASLDNIDIMSLLDMDALLNAFLESLQEVATERAEAYIEQFKAEARIAIINELSKLFCVEIPQDATNEEIRDILRANFRTAIINELNKFFCVEIPQNATNEEIEAIIGFRLLEIECQHADKIVKKLEFLKKISSIFCCGPCDICDCIDNLINCISTKCVVKPILNSDPKVVAYRVLVTPGNQVKIDVNVEADYIVNIYSDVETKTFSGAYSGTYAVGEVINIPAGDFVVSITMKKIPATYNVNSFTISY